MSGRDRILQAAAKAFGRRPYAEVSIAPILAEAEVQAPTLYYHFKDKEGLFVAWAEDLFLPLRLGIGSAETLEDALAAFASLYFSAIEFDLSQVIRDIPHLERAASREAVYAGYFQRVYEPLCQLLIEGLERGELRPEPIEPIADLFLSGLSVLQVRLDKDLASVASWYAHRFLHGHRA